MRRSAGRSRENGGSMKYRKVKHGGPRETHGGSRKNAGRKPSIDAAKNLNIRIDAETLRVLAELSAKWQCSQSEAVRRAIREA